MLIKFSLISAASLIFLQPSLKIMVNEEKKFKNNDEYIKIKNLINESEHEVVKNNLMDIDIFKKYKKDFLEIVDSYYQNEQSNNSVLLSPHIFDSHFWTNELNFSWSWVNLYVWMSSVAIEQFTEAINMGVTAAAFVAGLGTVIPGFGLAIGIYMVANMTMWRHYDNGNGVTSRYLFGLVPTGYWAEN